MHQVCPNTGTMYNPYMYTPVDDTHQWIILSDTSTVISRQTDHRLSIGRKQTFKYACRSNIHHGAGHIAGFIALFRLMSQVVCQMKRGETEPEDNKDC